MRISDWSSDVCSSDLFIMNRSRYIARALDPVDRAICLALSQNARLTIRELARIIGLSSPSATERMRRLEDSGVISGYTITVDNQVVGQPVGVHFRFHPIAGDRKSTRLNSSH